MALTEAQRVDIRRHLGYGVIGNLPLGGSFISYRFFVEQGLLEFRINALSPSEEAVLVGSATQPVVGVPLNPNFQDPDNDNVYDGYLNICNVLEGKIATASGNLDTDKAGMWTARKEEIAQRMWLYNIWCRRMAQYLYLPMGAGTPTMRTAPMPGRLIN